RASDDNSETIAALLKLRLPEWEANDILPIEEIDELSNYDRGHRLYGVHRWSEMFSSRQLLCHGTSVEIYREMLEKDRANGKLTELRKAAYVYLALSIDTALNYGNRSCRWDTA